MEELIDFKGHFTIQSIDKDGNIIDEYKDNNMIMETARSSMAMMFGNLNSNTFINKFRLGTMGHRGDSIITPKDKNDGFVKERDRMFSEATEYATNANITPLRINDIVKYTSDNTYYKYLGTDVSEYTVTAEGFTDTESWENLGTDKPFI